jgi:hypothetical protein
MFVWWSRGFAALPTLREISALLNANGVDVVVEVRGQRRLCPCPPFSNQHFASPQLWTKLSLVINR